MADIHDSSQNYAFLSPPAVESPSPSVEWPFVSSPGDGATLAAAGQAGAARVTGSPSGAGPSLAFGLAGIADWSTEDPFIDLMKSARPWVGHLRGQWGGWDQARLASGGWLDAAGWPKGVPPELSGISTLVLTDRPEAAKSLAGRYRITYRGEGRISLDGRVSRVQIRPGEIWFDYAPGPGSVIVTIEASDPRGVGDYVRDLAIVKADDVDLHEAGAIFSPAWRNRIADVRSVRFMDWMATNGSTQSSWAGRPRPSDYTYAWRGAPVEVMVALANDLGSDPWFSMPHAADDAYVAAFAAYVRDALDDRRQAFVEYSNELWNWGFEQTRWAQAQAEARWGSSAGGDAWIQFAGMRAAQVAGVWDSAFGQEAETRLVKVVGTQTGWLGLEQAMLDAPLWVAEDPARNRPPYTAFDAYAVTGYFGNDLGGAKAPMVREWLAESREEAARDADARGLVGARRAAAMDAARFDGAIARAAAELRDGSQSGEPADSLGALLGELLPYQAEVARSRGLRLVMYEGGTHVVASPENRDDAELTDFLVALNYSPEMARLYEELLVGWREIGGGPFNAFVDVEGPSKWGSWGALRHVDDDNPRWRALARINVEVPAWWEERPSGAFDHGLLLKGGKGDDALEGGARADTIAGGAGDDVLTGGEGDDRLHGGNGADVALLPGRAADYRFEPAEGATIARGPRATFWLRSVETLRFADEPGETVALRASD